MTLKHITAKKSTHKIFIFNSDHQRVSFRIQDLLAYGRVFIHVSLD